MTPLTPEPPESEPEDERPHERDIDQEIRINELRHEIESRGGTFGTFDKDLPPDLEEAFLQSILDYETGPFATHLDLLGRDGVVLPPPEEVTNEALPEMLQVMFEGLAKRGTMVLSTDHLSDRELYQRMWRDVLREEVLDSRDCPGGQWCLDLVSSGSEEDIEAWLTYYADENTRADWVKQFPDYILPPHKDPPFDRDRHLPRPAFPEIPMGDDSSDDPTDDEDIPF